MDITERRTHILIVLAFALSGLSLSLASISAKAAESPEVFRACLSVLYLSLPLIHYYLVCLLYFFEFFFISGLVGVSHVGVRVILTAQFSVCFFDFIIRSVVAYAQHFIWIHLYL